jgi:hypothetical protein
MIGRIERTPPKDRFSFVIAGDSGAWADPTADAIYSELVAQVAELDPSPLFFANLGDFAGPGTPDRHEHYVAMMERLRLPNICVIGNHDLDDAHGWDNFESIHGPANYDFGYSHTRFVVIHAEPGVVGQIDVPGIGTAAGTRGPGAEDLEFLVARLRVAPEPNRVVLLHTPPYLGGHYEPHAEWGFKQRETEFMQILREHDVQLVCCAHGLAFDTHIERGIRFVMSGGGGTGLCSHYRGVCTAGEAHPEDRGALYHAVQIEVSPSGSIAGRVIQAFDRSGRGRIEFGDTLE